MACLLRRRPACGPAPDMRFDLSDNRRGRIMERRQCEVRPAAFPESVEAPMKLCELLPRAGLPALALAGLAGGAAANIGAAAPEIPAEIAAGPHCRVANLPAQILTPEAVLAYEEAPPPLWNDLGS